MDVSPLPYADRSRLVFHGAALFLLGLVAGLIFTFEAIGHVAVWPVIPQLAIDFPGDEAGWRKVHLGFIVNAMAVLLFAAASGHASLGPRAGKVFMVSVITTGWGNSVGFLIGALFASKAGIDVLSVPYKGAAPAMNDVVVDLRRGSLFEPVAGERYDLVVSNPPFVVGAGTRDYEYRDSGMAGDTLCRNMIEQVPDHLG